MSIELIHGDCMAGWSNKCKGSYFYCPVCSFQFWRKPNQIKKGQNKYCSKKCYQYQQVGKPKSEIFKEYCRSRVGDKSPTWKGGVTPLHLKIRTSTKYREWRNSVFIRDNYTCQSCGIRCGNGTNVHLHAHHIKSFANFPDQRFDLNNGMTLCKQCHYKEHSNA